MEWADAGAKIRVLILFEPSPERRFFDDLPDANFFEVKPPFFWPLDGRENGHRLLGDGDNWNPLRDIHDHPLRNEFIGYLGHCLIEHESLPWRFFDRIRRINVDIQIQGDWDYGPAAEPSGAGLPGHEASH
jgi:hypothetical protein